MSAKNPDHAITAPEQNPSKAQLYYLERDEDSDCYVIAESVEQAVQLWRKYFASAKLDYTMPDFITLVPIDELLNRTPRALDWIDLEKKGNILWRG